MLALRGEKARRFWLGDASSSDAQAKPRCAQRANSNLSLPRSCCGACTQTLCELGEFIALLECCLTPELSGRPRRRRRGQTRPTLFPGPLGRVVRPVTPLTLVHLDPALEDSARGRSE
jgi:hypothetical protein